MAEKEAKPVTKAELEEFAGAVRERLSEMEKETVSREEFATLTDAVGKSIKLLKEPTEKQPTKPQDVKFLRCTEKGCTWQTTDEYTGAYIEHVLKHFKETFIGKLRELSSPEGHRTVEELIDCKECFPKLVSAVADGLIKKGFVKRPEEYTCPDCGSELVTPLLEKPYCPKCGWKRR